MGQSPDGGSCNRCGLHGKIGADPLMEKPMFRALMLEKDADGPAHATIRDIDDAALPAGDVLVAVDYSTVNYKDGLCLSPTGGS